MKTPLTGETALPFDVSSKILKQFSDAISQGAERAQAMVGTGLRSWESEVERYYQEFSANSRETLEALEKCEGAAEVLHVEQKWMQARAQAYFESGQRFAKIFAHVARAVPAQCAATKAAIDEVIHGA